MIGHLVTGVAVVRLYASAAIAAEPLWKIFDVKGKASLTVDRATKPLSNAKNLLEAVKKGSLIKVDGPGKVVVVSLKSRQAFEIGDNSEGVIEEDQVRAVKGSVAVKKGLSLPKGSDGKMGGIVMRGAGNTRSCLKALSPSNTSLLDLAPELRWENNCDGLKAVTVTVLADDKVVHAVETAENTLKVPEGIVQPGSRYMWLVDGGANFDMASGIFTVLPENDRQEVLQRKSSYDKESADDVAAMLAYIYFLDGKGLRELAANESERIKQRFPGADALKELP